jgi:hypothetical protein
VFSAPGRSPGSGGGQGLTQQRSRAWSGQVGTANLHCRARSRPSELARQGGGEGCGIRQPATDSGNRGKSLQRHRGERIERNFVHRFDTGELGRLYVRGKENVHKKFLIQAAACNLALLMRSMYGSGKPRAAHDRIVDAILSILALMKAVEDILTASSAMFYREHRISRGSDRCH